MQRCPVKTHTYGECHDESTAFEEVPWVVTLEPLGQWQHVSSRTCRSRNRCRRLLVLHVLLPLLRVDRELQMSI